MVPPRHIAPAEKPRLATEATSTKRAGANGEDGDLQSLLKVSRAIDAFNTFVGRWLSWLIVVAVLISAVNAVVRKVFDLSSNAFLELQWVLFSVVFLLCAPWTLLKGEHIRIDIINHLLPLKVRSWIDMIGHIFFLIPFCLILIWTSIPFFIVSYQQNEQSFSAGGLPQWPAICAIYWSRVDDIPDGEFAKTFFNSVHRDILRDLHVDPTQVSDTADVVRAEAPLRYPARQHNYVNWSNVRAIVRRLLADFQFKTPYVDVEADVDFICAEIARVVGADGTPDEAVRRLEMMHDVFYQSSRAFVVGKMFWGTHNCPFVLAFENTNDGVRVEAVLTSSDDVSVLFGFTRSYFMVDVEPVEGAVYFIKAMISLISFRAPIRTERVA